MRVGEVDVDKIIWGIVPSLVLVAGLHLVRASRSERYALGAIAFPSGLAFGPQCLCKDFADALVGDLIAAGLAGIVLLPVVLLLRTAVLAFTRPSSDK